MDFSFYFSLNKLIKHYIIMEKVLNYIENHKRVDYVKVERNEETSQVEQIKIVVNSSHNLREFDRTVFVSPSEISNFVEVKIYHKENPLQSNIVELYLKYCGRGWIEPIAFNDKPFFKMTLPIEEVVNLIYWKWSVIN